MLLTDLVLIPFLVPRCRDNGVPGQFRRRISLSHSNLSARGRPAQQTGTGHIHTVLRSFVRDKGILHNRAGRADLRWSFGKHLVILSRRTIQVSVNLPCEKSRRAGRSLGCKNSMGDGGHPCSTPTTDL